MSKKKQNRKELDLALQKELARKQLLQNLADYGVLWDEEQRKFEAKSLRDTQLKLSKVTNIRGLQFSEKVKDYFASPNDINIDKIEPYLVPVEGNGIENKIWAYALTFWSVPVSAGYGRRMRYLVFDKQNDKLIGVFGLCDPLIGFNIRDNYIGWNREQKHERLYNCLAAYILGAVPPYNLVLGSKLVALTAMFADVRKDFYKKYKDRETIIAGKKKLPKLVMIDTFGAFKKSAIYTRLMNWKFIDYTEGKSHIHITANGSWELIKEFVPKDYFNRYKFGQGSNWKMRTLRVGLENLGFDREDLLSIGWQRAYYMCPLITNWKEFLTMKHKRPKFIKNTNQDLVNYWKERWVNPRKEKLKNKPQIIDSQ